MCAQVFGLMLWFGLVLKNITLRLAALLKRVLDCLKYNLLSEFSHYCKGYIHIYGVSFS